MLSSCQCVLIYCCYLHGFEVHIPSLLVRNWYERNKIKFEQFNIHNKIKLSRTVWSHRCIAKYNNLEACYDVTWSLWMFVFTHKKKQLGYSYVYAKNSYKIFYRAALMLVFVVDNKYAFWYSRLSDNSIGPDLSPLGFHTCRLVNIYQYLKAL